MKGIMFSFKNVMQRSILYSLRGQGVYYDMMAWFPIYFQGRTASEQHPCFYEMQRSF